MCQMGSCQDVYIDDLLQYILNITVYLLLIVRSRAF